MEQSVDTQNLSYAGLRYRELVEWGLNEGQERCLEQLNYNSTQLRYFQAVARSAGVEWPDGFFSSTVEELMDNH